ncbi:collagen binding domain-containing protein [Oryzobacter telluris]|uniref:MSCRAMM family protein n=1 Tax=Oryzobacter telluris TaxID=3149179 RepID=UPI00370DA1B5
MRPRRHALRALVLVAVVTGLSTSPAVAAQHTVAPRAATAAQALPSLAAATEPAGYVPLSPARLLDTRSTGATVDGVGKGGGTVKGGTPRAVQVTGRGGIPSSGVSAVVLNVTAVKPSASTFVTVYPDGETRPNTSNLNIVAGSVTPNLVVTKVGSNGKVAFFVNAGASDVLADVAGYFPAGGSFVPLSPARLMDTRSTGATIDGQGKGGGAIAQNGTRTLTVGGRYGIPTTGVESVVLNVTGVAPTAGTFLTVWPAGATRPTTSNLNLKKGEVRPNLVVVKLGTAAAVSFFNSMGSVNVLADVAGYIPTGTTFHSLTPGRLLDTRSTGATVDGQGKGAGALGAGGVVDVQVTGRYGIPSSGVRSVILNVTGVAPTSTTFVTAYPTGEAPPNASNLNLITGEVRPNLVIAKVGTGGKVRLRNNAGSTHLLADVAGYFVAPTSSTPAQLSGTVTDAGGTHQPLAGVDVQAALDGTDESEIATTDVDGHYEFTGLTAGEYTVCFDAAQATGGSKDAAGYIRICHGQTSDSDPPTPVTVTTNGSTVVDQALTAGASIAGKVTQVTTNSPLREVMVNVYNTSSGDDSGNFGDNVFTGTDGTFVAKGLIPGDYTLCFDATDALGGNSDATGYINECYQDVTEFINQIETPVTVVSGQVKTGVNASLARGAALKGTVKEDGTNKPLEGVSVYSEHRFPDPDNQPWYREEYPYATTDASGNWVMKGLMPGQFTVCFDGQEATGGTSDATGYVPECHLNTKTGVPEDNTPVSVSIGAATTVDAGLARAGAIAGKVVQDGGSTPLADVSISVYSATTDSFGGTQTASDGTYIVRGLAPGTDYEICFMGADATGGTSTTGYGLECYNDGTPTDVPVTAGVTSTANAGLAIAGAIKGRVTDSVGGAGVASADVILYDPVSGNSYTATGEDGSYEFKGLDAGSDYIVCVDTYSAEGASTTGYVPECFDNQPYTDLDPVGTAVSVSTGVATTVNLSLARGAAIAGKVSDGSGGAGLGDVYITVLSPTSEYYDVTADDGTYRVSGLPAGTQYVVCFDGSGATGASLNGYDSECYNDKPFDSQDPSLNKVTTTAGNATTVNAALARL